MTSHPGVGMGVVWWLIVGRGSDIMHPGSQWAWLMSLMMS